MTRREEYRDFAKRCIRTAESARPNHRRVLLHLAEFWAEMATEIEDRAAAHDGHRPRQPSHHTSDLH